MTYEEAARTLSRYYKHNFGPTVPPSNPSLKTSLEMAIDLLFKRAAQEKAVSYRECTMDDPNDEEVDISCLANGC